MQKRRSRLGENGIWPYVLLLPALIVMVSVVVIPIINAVGMSFQYYNLTRPNRTAFIGLDNYAKILGSKLFWQSLWRTLIWVFFGVGLQFVFGFMLALLLNRDYRGRGVVRAVSLIPWVTPGVLIALMWRWIMDGNYGVLNDVLKRLGLISENIAWLATKSTALPSVITTIVWQGIPFFALMLLAGLQGISYDLYEAASIDGAGRFNKIRYITLPGIKSTFVILLIMNIGHLMDAGFEIQYLLGSSLVMDWSQTIDIFVLKYGISKQQYGVATAAGMFKSIVAIILLFAANTIAKRMDEATLI